MENGIRCNILVVFLVSSDSDLTNFYNNKMAPFSVFITIILLAVAQVSSFNERFQYSRVKRGYSGMYETFGNSRQSAMNQLADNQKIAQSAAQSAVTYGIGQVYGHEQAAFRHIVHEYLIPMKKYQQSHLISSTSPSSTSNNDQYKDISHNSADSTPSSSVAASSSASLTGKNIEKFTVSESQPSKQASAGSSRVSKEVSSSSGGSNGNGHRRDTAGGPTTRKDNSKKISATVKSSNEPQETSSSEKKEVKQETEVISVGDEEEDDDDKAV